MNKNLFLSVGKTKKIHLTSFNFNNVLISEFSLKKAQVLVKF